MVVLPPGMKESSNEHSESGTSNTVSVSMECPGSTEKDCPGSEA